MKNFKLILILATALFFSCQSTSEKLTPEEIVRIYFEGLNNSDYKSFSKHLSDSIVSKEGDYVIFTTRQDFYTHFRWDSVFVPKYKIIEMKAVKEKFEVTVSKTCKRIKFLHDSPTVYKTIFSFENNKIKEMTVNEFITFDFEKWQQRRDSLVSWIDKKHPELSGFIHDQTLTGGQNYMKAIDLYNNVN